ncbi:MAG: M28 family peptidase [Desulfocapsa sp.]|nr:M28 family peptidase [Desulfocapsa sp.]
MSIFRILTLSFAFLLISCLATSFAAPQLSLREQITHLSSSAERNTGSSGCQSAAVFIKEQFQAMGLMPESYRFSIPVRQETGAVLQVGDASLKLNILRYNAITPEATDGFLSGPLYYVGSGKWSEMKGMVIKDSIVILDMDSGQDWQQLASLGARAIIYLNHTPNQSKYLFQEKEELTPIQLPCFWMEKDALKQIFPGDSFQKPTLLAKDVKLSSAVQWHEVTAENIYTLIPGTDPEHKKELLVVEAFYDSSGYVAGRAPGADEAASIATLLQTAQQLQNTPPARSVLLVATSGHNEALAGMRDLVWSINSRSKELRNYNKQLKNGLKTTKLNLQTLTELSWPLHEDQERDAIISQAMADSLNLSVDALSRELITLRLQQSKDIEKTAAIQATIKKLSKRRLLYRRLGWQESFHDLEEGEASLFRQTIPEAIKENTRRKKELTSHLKTLKSASAFRKHLADYDIAAFVSLHLSSHGNGIGAFHQGFLYKLKASINRTGIFSNLADILDETAKTSKSSTPYVNTLRPSRLRSWDSWFLDKPALGGEVASLAGFLGITLVSTGDARALWGTPWDSPQNINWSNLENQAALIADMVHAMAGTAALHSGKLPRNGFSTVSGRANLLLQGELFANYPAAKTILLAYQGMQKHYAAVDSSGTFRIKGVADKKHVLDKVIIEGYRFDEKTGLVLWTIDKRLTGKSNYRVKISKSEPKTDLILFSCKETTIFGLLEPRTFHYLTKVSLLDGRRDAPPQHFWYSRIDTRNSTMASIYTEPGTWLKATLSDNVLTRKMILTNGSPENPMGFGYPVDQYSAIHNTVYRVACDLWTLLSPRIENLESHGIFDDKINQLKERGQAAQLKAETSLANYDYATFSSAASESMALANRVYMQVEKTQKDVLFGVLFYIALFVPFAFCMERFLFNYANIYKRIIAFSAILLVLIGVIRQVHPAFQLAYSPTVVILAFFILGLSLMVSLIIFFRFEEEMILLQRRASHKRPAEISHWKAFTAAFFLGVSNLRRRRLRTVLTCLTLIILTFTIMSFTTVKSGERQSRLFFQEDPPYHGLLLKRLEWRSLPVEAVNNLVEGFQDAKGIAPRIWLEAGDASQAVHVPLQHGTNSAELQGLIGLSPSEADITGLDNLLTKGRWFTKADRLAIILDQDMADALVVKTDGSETIKVWGYDFTVIGSFSGSRIDQTLDLDGESLTPVTFPEESGAEITEVEQEAIESGDDIRSFQSRYHHIPASQVAIIPAATLLTIGGKLKNLAVLLNDHQSISATAERLVDRFSMAIFTGEKDGVWLYNQSDSINYKGIPNILIPLLISIFIVLNTMISSVYERKNEIAIYTSVGLAPSHVSFLFVAEALALAVISVVLGYLLAQVSASLLADTSLWAGLTVNYSSMAGVAAMILVIGVVLLSVIYPSRVAARIAIPDVNASFSLPPAVNNRITVILPFLMKYEEHDSISGFIYNYFSSHQDVSHGLFSTGPVDLVFSCSTIEQIYEMVNRAERPHEIYCTYLRTKVWLAPFDFGIMQWVDIQFSPAVEDSSYLEIKITMERRSGEKQVWQRINTSFLHNLRKQLLVWRSIDDAGHTHFAKLFRKIAATPANGEKKQEILSRELKDQPLEPSGEDKHA